MLDFTSLFGMGLDTLGLTSSLSSAASTMRTGCSYLVGEVDGSPALGTSLISTATSSMNSTINSCFDKLEQIEIAQAYIESLSEEELKEFILKLEDNEASFVVEVSEDVKVKKYKI